MSNFPKHIPLLQLDGKEIKGIKRCSVCGLSETYWKRFPVCESKSQAKKINVQLDEPPAPLLEKPMSECQHKNLVLQSQRGTDGEPIYSCGVPLVIQQLGKVVMASGCGALFKVQPEEITVSYSAADVGLGGKGAR